MTCSQVHNGLYPKHETITPAEWMELKPVRDSMYCERHKRYPVTTGCKRCSMICCNVCLKNENHNPCPSEFSIKKLNYHRCQTLHVMMLHHWLGSVKRDRKNKIFLFTFLTRGKVIPIMPRLNVHNPTGFWLETVTWNAPLFSPNNILK